MSRRNDQGTADGPVTVDTLAADKRLDPARLRLWGVSDLADGGVAVAYYGRSGEPLFVRERDNPARRGRFWQPARTGLAPYGRWLLGEARGAGHLVLVEGESDCWAFWSHGLPALGLPGSGAHGCLAAEDLDGLDAVYVHREPDRGGEAFLHGCVGRLRALGFGGRVYELRLGRGVKDPADLHAADPGAFERRLAEARAAARELSLVRAAANGRHQQNGTARGPGPAPAVETFADDELMRMELPEPRWAVDGILPEGMSVLAGKPKLGKSWLALNVALAVASGGVALGDVPVGQGSVLYLALEDTPRRLQARLRKLLDRQDAKPPAALTLACRWPRQGAGGLEAVEGWLAAHRDARLVVVDTWVRFKPVRVRGANEYEEDTAHGSAVKDLADARGVSVLVITHCRKMPAADPLEEVMGSQGLTGVADGTLVLRRERGQHDAALFVTGRDVEEQELALRWDPQHALWTVAGPAAEYRLSRERAEVVALLRRHGQPMSPAEVAELLGKARNAVKFLMWSMAKDAQLRPAAGGKYEAANHANRTNRGPAVSGPDEETNRELVIKHPWE
jgi:hypothetical protein